MTGYGILEMPAGQRPCEKFERYGESALSDAELLAVIIRSGQKGRSSLALAEEVLALCPYREGLCGLYNLSVEQLLTVKGIGRVKAVQLKCIAGLSKRMAAAKAERCLDFKDPASIADYYMERLKCEEREMVYCMMLDTRNALIKDLCISIGTVNCSLLSPREVFSAALEYHAVSIVLVHNHPSGDPAPSPEDISATEKMFDAGELIGIRLLDHIILGRNTYKSLVRY